MHPICVYDSGNYSGGMDFMGDMESLLTGTPEEQTQMMVDMMVEQSRTALQQVPGMTEETMDSLMDQITTSVPAVDPSTMTHNQVMAIMNDTMSQVMTTVMETTIDHKKTEIYGRFDQVFADHNQGDNTQLIQRAHDTIDRVFADMMANPDQTEEEMTAGAKAAMEQVLSEFNADEQLKTAVRDLIDQLAAGEREITE